MAQPYDVGSDRGARGAPVGMLTGSIASISTRSRADDVFYNLVEFPYPSAEGLHVGHVYRYGGVDTYGRYQRMRGKQVFQPIGFDAFGIHTENYALRVGEHPRPLTARTIGALPRPTGASWAWRGTGVGRSTPVTRATTAGRSGS